MLFKNSVRTSKRTPHFTITNINWLTLFKEIIAVYSENHMEHKQNAALLTVRADGTYIYHWTSKGKRTHCSVPIYLSYRIRTEIKCTVTELARWHNKITHTNPVLLV
jgi:hypothetical protein